MYNPNYFVVYNIDYFGNELYLIIYCWNVCVCVCTCLCI